MVDFRHCVTLAFCCCLGIPTGLRAQVHYDADGAPWSRRADRGPDRDVPGWFYNLGTTGMRVSLMADEPRALKVEWVFADSPAHGKVRAGDVLVGVAGARFATDHRNGYGMEVFGADGPILEFAQALDACLAAQRQPDRGALPITLRRDGEVVETRLRLGSRHGTYATDFPDDCAKTERVRGRLLEWLAAEQRDDGSWGSPPHDTFAPLALLASGDRRYLRVVERNVRMHARTTKATDESWLINWRYMAAAIVMSEYYLATQERWVLPELEEVHRFLLSSQYTDMAQIHPKTREDRPQDLPRTPMSSHGGWGHNPGFEGYGPISMLTGQGALALALMARCGVGVDRERHDYAYDFLARGTGRNGYVWYEDQVAGHKNWADMGRTGAAGIANFLSPYPDEKYRQRALAHAAVIGEHPASFPDTHGCPTMGMGYAAMAAHVDATAFHRLMQANRWWFVLAECADGTFYYQPNRDNAGYGWDSRLSASAVVAFIYSLPLRSLYVSGKAPK